MALANVTLEDKYTLDTGRVYLNGTQALVRLPMMQRRRHAAASQVARAPRCPMNIENCRPIEPETARPSTMSSKERPQAVSRPSVATRPTTSS